MNVLAVDTSNEQGSVALAREDDLLEVIALPSGWRSTTLHLEIARLLDRHGLTTRDIQGYGVTTGPGSFTGIRVGLTAVKGLAEVHGKPIVAVSTLQTMAAAAQSAWQLPKQTMLVTILDARRGQIFGGVYREQEGWLRPLIEECVCSLRTFLDRIIASIKVSDIARASEMALQGLSICGTDLAPFIPEIEKAGWARTSIFSVPPSLAGPLAQIATRGLQQGLGVPASSAEANYVRPSDAELFWKG